MLLWLSFGLSELMLWILLPCVPLIDVVSMAAVPSTHWGPGPQSPPELNGEWWGIEPRAGRHTDSDLPQRFQSWQPQLPSKDPEPLVELDSEVSYEQPQLPWKYPEPPVEPESEVPDDVQLVKPVMVPHLAMKCGINTVKIEVQKDLWGNGNLVEEDDLTLGGCAFTEFDRSANVISFEYKLELCCSEKSMTDDFITYTYVLEHRPKMSARIPITRTQNTNIEMKCHYPRQVISKPVIQRPIEEPVMPE